MSYQIINFPGFIDCHVHFRQPGFPEKATMASEAAAAKAGGVLTVCEMPNTSPPTTSVETFRDKYEKADKITDCDIRFFFGITGSDHLKEFIDLQTKPENRELKKKCCGVKLYMDNSTGNQKAKESIVEDIFKTSAELDVPLVAHCEDSDINKEASQSVSDSAPVHMHSIMRPPESEQKAINKAIELAAKYGTSFHVAHLSTSFGIDLVAQAKKDGLKVSCEIAPHHLFLTTEDYGRLGTLVKMNPPLRSPDHQLALWEGVLDGTVDCIATDHAPHTLKEKQINPPLSAPSGVTGVQTMIPLLLTVAADRWPHPNQKPRIDISGFAYEDIVRLCFTNPNRIFRLNASNENRLTVDPDAEWTIKAANLNYKCGWTPYEGWKMVGKIVKLL